jgi:hypothetical protein
VETCHHPQSKTLKKTRKKGQQRRKGDEIVPPSACFE